MGDCQIRHNFYKLELKYTKKLMKVVFTIIVSIIVIYIICIYSNKESGGCNVFPSSDKIHNLSKLSHNIYDFSSNNSELLGIFSNDHIDDYSGDTTTTNVFDEKPIIEGDLFYAFCFLEKL